jgi:hypothetical protein
LLERVAIAPRMKYRGLPRAGNVPLAAPAFRRPLNF